MRIDAKKLADLFEKQEPVILAYLYGSAAKGKGGKLSDIDIAVYLDESLSKSERFNQQLHLLYELTGILKTDKIDLAIMNDAPLSLKYEIISANCPLFARDEGKRIDIEHMILSRYLDRRFYDKRWADELLKKASGKDLQVGHVR